MSCCGSESCHTQPQKFNGSWLVSLVYWFTSRLFHSFYPKRSERRHQHVMRLFQFCADRGHVLASSVYGHILLFRGVSPWDKKQGVDYLSYAAEQGDAKAAYQMSELISEETFGLQGDEGRIFGYLLMAAKADHLLAQQKLLALVESGSEHRLADMNSTDKAFIKQLQSRHC